MSADFLLLPDDPAAPGVALRVVGGRLQCKPRGALTPELVERLREAKPLIVALATTLDGSDDARFGLCRGDRAADKAEKRACYMCGLRVWRTLPDGRVLCAVCNPPTRRAQFNLDDLVPRRRPRPIGAGQQRRRADRRP